MLVVLLAVLGWLAIVGCYAAMCTIASRGDRDEGPATNLEEWVRVAAFAQPSDAFGFAPLARRMRDRGMSIARPLRGRRTRGR